MSLRLFGKNAVIYAIGNVGVRAASFLIIPLYTHSLSVNDFGLLMTLLLTTQLMLKVMNCGMWPGLVRFAKTCEKDNRISELLGTSCTVNVLGGLAVTGVSLTLLIPFFRSVLHSQDVYAYIGLACGISLLQSLSVHMMSYYRAQNKAVRFMVTGIMTAVVLFVASYMMLCVWQMGIIGALLAKTVTYALILLLISLDILRITGFGVSFSLARNLIQFGLPLLFSMSGEFVIRGASVYFLSLLSGLETVAIYSLGLKLASVLSIAIILPFQLSFEPYVFANLDSPRIKRRMSLLLTYLVLAVAGASFCILVGSRLLMPLIAPPEYSSPYTVILLLLPGMTFWGVYYFAQTLLSAIQKTHIVGLAMTICVALCIPLNYILIRALSSYGAIIASNVTLVSIGSALLIISLRKFPIPIEKTRICIAAGLLVLFLFVLFVVRDTDLISYLVVASLTALGGTVLLFTFRFFDHDERLLIRKLIPSCYR